MKNIFKKQNNFNIEDLKNSVSQMYEILSSLKQKKLSKQQKLEILESIGANQDTKGYVTLIDIERSNGDARFDFIYIPTCLATAILIELYYDEEVENYNVFDLLDKAIRFIVKRGFNGVGYEAEEGFIICANIFNSENVNRFVNEQKSKFIDFYYLIIDIPKRLKSIKESETNWIISKQTKEDANKILDNLYIKNNKTLYFAYGSNMDKIQMEDRCKDSEFLGKAKIRGYKLNFRKSNSGYYATLDRDNSSFVEGVLWEISSEDEINLDRYEGVHARCYIKKNLPILQKGKKLNALVYILPETKESGKPYDYYYDGIKKSYEEYGFNKDNLPKV